MAELTLEEYMALSFSNFGPRTKFLKSWKKRSPAKLDLWLHTKFGFKSVIAHRMPKIVVREDRQTGQQKTSVYGEQYVCWDSDARITCMMRNQPFDEAKAVCPLCLFLRRLQAMYEAGHIAASAKILEFIGDEELESITVAGALDLDFETIPDEDEEKLKQMGITPKNAWQQNAQPKQQFVFALVDNDSPADGVQITTETKLVGEKLKDVIYQEMARNSPDGQFYARQTAGNPLAEPYCIRFVYNAREPQFYKKYNVMALPKVPLTEEIRRMIVDEDPPNTDHVTKPFNAHGLKALLEQCSLMPLPLDEAFEAALVAEDQAARDDPAVQFDPTELEKPVAKPAVTAQVAPKQDERPKPPPPANKRRQVVKEPEPPAVELGDPCEACGAPMAKDAAKCEGCGAQYEIDTAAQQAEDQLNW